MLMKLLNQMGLLGHIQVREMREGINISCHFHKHHARKHPVEAGLEDVIKSCKAWPGLPIGGINVRSVVLSVTIDSPVKIPG